MGFNLSTFPYCQEPLIDLCLSGGHSRKAGPSIYDNVLINSAVASIDAGRTGDGGRNTETIRSESVKYVTTLVDP